ncbi:MAG: hypothetical protein AAF585_21300 [Verrucomicrobiota bacterium]
MFQSFPDDQRTILMFRGIDIPTLEQRKMRFIDGSDAERSSPAPASIKYLLLGEGPAVGASYDEITQLLRFFPHPDTKTGNRSVVNRLLKIAGLANEKVLLRWDAS